MAAKRGGGGAWGLLGGGEELGAGGVEFGDVGGAFWGFEI